MARRGTERPTITWFMWRERIVSAPRRRNKKGLTTRKLFLIARARRVVAGKTIRKWRRLASGAAGKRRAKTESAEVRSQPRALRDCVEFNLEEENGARRKSGSYLVFRFPSIPYNKWFFFATPRGNPRGADYSASFRAIKMTITPGITAAIARSGFSQQILTTRETHNCKGVKTPWKKNLVIIMKRWVKKRQYLINIIIFD